MPGNRPPLPPQAPARSPAPVYEAETRGIAVRVTTDFLPEESSQAKSRWVWSYTVEIENRGRQAVQLVSRHWIITDGLNRTEEVRGPGVVGAQPALKPGEAFRYTSACPLPTSSGLMRGSYRMVTPEGDSFDVATPSFSLDLPEAGRRPN
jgi:ApaG protein